MDGSGRMSTVVEVDVVPRPTKDQIRAAVFHGNNKKQKTKIIDFLGAKIEIRQPLLADIVNQSGENKISEVAVIQTLCAYAYVPGTDERIFDEADEESFLAMPFGKDFKLVQETLEELTSISFDVGRRD